jgi:hypothetical protein
MERLPDVIELQHTARQVRNLRLSVSRVTGIPNGWELVDPGHDTTGAFERFEHYGTRVFLDVSDDQARVILAELDRVKEAYGDTNTTQAVMCRCPGTGRAFVSVRVKETTVFSLDGDAVIWRDVPSKCQMPCTSLRVAVVVNSLGIRRQGIQLQALECHFDRRMPPK